VRCLDDECGPSSWQQLRGRSDLDAGPDSAIRRLDSDFLVDVELLAVASCTSRRRPLSSSRCADLQEDNAGRQEAGAASWRAHIVGPLGRLHRGNRIGSLRLRHVLRPRPLQGVKAITNSTHAARPPTRRAARPDASATPAAPASHLSRGMVRCACFSVASSLAANPPAPLGRGSADQVFGVWSAIFVGFHD